MVLIGKIDDMPIFKIDVGEYVAVDTDNKTCLPMWCWYANLGKWFDTFEKCSSCDNEVEAIGVIEENINSIVKTLNSLQNNLDDEDGKEFLKEQEKFYEWLDDGRVYNWFDGYEDGSAEDQNE